MKKRNIIISVSAAVVITAAIAALAIAFRNVPPELTFQDAESATIELRGGTGNVEVEVSPETGSGIVLVPEVESGAVYLRVQSIPDYEGNYDVYWDGYVETDNTLSFPNATGPCVVAVASENAIGQINVNTFTEETWNTLADEEEARYLNDAREELEYGLKMGDDIASQ